MASDVIGSALVGLAVGAAAVAIGTSIAKRKEFREQLAVALHEHNLELENSELGRDASGVYWRLTIRHARVGIQVLVVRLGDQDPYSMRALDFMLERVAWWARQAA
jgi:hypothetical protein